MSKIELDSLDCKILRILSSNARKPFLEVARECGVSGAAIHQRVQKLTQHGVLEGFDSLINPSAVGYETCAYIGLFLKDPAAFDDVVERLKGVPEVVECHCTTGKYDLLVKLYARNNDHLLDLITTKLQNIVPGRTETLISFKQKFHRQVPIDEINFN